MRSSVLLSTALLPEVRLDEVKEVAGDLGVPVGRFRRWLERTEGEQVATINDLMGFASLALLFTGEPDLIANAGEINFNGLSLINLEEIMTRTLSDQTLIKSRAFCQHLGRSSTISHGPTYRREFVIMWLTRFRRNACIMPPIPPMPPIPALPPAAS